MKKNGKKDRYIDERKEAKHSPLGRSHRYVDSFVYVCVCAGGVWS